MVESFSSDPSIEELENRMRPGVFSQGGFLGENESLPEVMARDGQTLRELGLTHEELAARLDGLLKAASSSPRRSARVGHLHVRLEVFTGFQICPWAPNVHRGQCTAGGGVDYGSMEWRIRNLETGEELRGPGLAVHLIRDHHFFEGRDSPFRVDPARLARILGGGEKVGKASWLFSRFWKF